MRRRPPTTRPRFSLIGPSPSNPGDAFAGTPSNAWFGFRLVSAESGRAQVRLPPRDEFVQETGVVHGGILTALADTTAVYALLPGLLAGRTMTSIELKLNFLRPALASGGDLVATAIVVRQGRKIGLCDVEIVQADRLVAKGLFTYLVFEPRPDGP